MIKDLNSQGCLSVLRNHYIARLAYIANQRPYIVPITYYYFDKEESNIISYSSEGHKISAMRKNNAVSLVIDEIESITHWQSVVVHGTFEELSGTYAKSQLHQFSNGVKAIVNNTKGENVEFIKDFSSYLEQEGKSPVVYRIHITEITGKQRNG